ncbi:hypothetical protein Tco_1068459 [Tanacetum coccineum]|uniref:Reverse transcriptase domain-containing protein n=1 Tax=Tanacetum coccineum TaxID=301880 RepID=A0ABQ5HHI8_9ASTR
MPLALQCTGTSGDVLWQSSRYDRKTMEVFMDDFSILEVLSLLCLTHLEKMLKRCEDTNLALNWEKSHFMVKEGIVLGHKISKSGIEVDRAKIESLSPSSPPDYCKGVLCSVYRTIPCPQVLPSAMKDQGEIGYDGFCSLQEFDLIYSFWSKGCNPAEKKILQKSEALFLDDPFLFKFCEDQVIRRCVFSKEPMTSSWLATDGPPGGHPVLLTQQEKSSIRFTFGPTIYKDAQELV